jgi:phytoene desaturase
MNAPLRQADLPSRAAPHAVVIGAGFGGLAAAIRLQARGWRVTVLERCDQPGGRARVFRQDGFTFDAGPTIVTAPFLFEELWTLAGARLADDVKLVALDPFYQIRFDDGAVFTYSADPDAMRAEVARFSPGDVAGFGRLMARSAEIYRIGFEQLGSIPFLSFMDMVRIAPDLLRLGGLSSVYRLVSRHLRDGRLRTVFSFHPLLIGGNPFSASAVYALIMHLERAHGVHAAIGGTGALVAGMVRLIKRAGGTLRLGADVCGILAEGGRAAGVQLASGERIEADIVVSNADSATTYSRLLPGTRRWTPRRLARARYSMGLFVWYFGTSRRWNSVGQHTIVLGPRYRELVRDIFDRHVLAPDFSLYLHRPTATDPAMAPEGCDSFYVLSPVPHLDADVDWREAAEPYRAAIQQRLEATMLPGLGEAIVTSRMMTPLHFRDELASEKGAGFGLEPVLTQSAWFRPHNASEELPGLYLVGAGTHPGAGLPGVLASARVLDQVVPHAAIGR